MTLSNDVRRVLPPRLILAFALFGVACDRPPSETVDLASVESEIEALVWTFHAADTAMDADAVVASGAAALCTVGGPSGMGKTCLLGHFMDQLGDPARALRVPLRSAGLDQRGGCRADPRALVLLAS